MKSSINVLIVDDERYLADNLARLLNSRGFQAAAEYNGEDALQKVLQEQFDVIISDIKMPGMNGIELLMRLKKLSPHTEVIMLTGYADVETGNRAIREGAFDYLFKPVEDIELLADKIRETAKAKQIRKNPVLWPRKRIRDLSNIRFTPLVKESPLVKALELFDPAQSGTARERLHVTDFEGMLCGVITRSDLIRAAEENINKKVEWKDLLKNPGWLPDKKVKDNMSAHQGLYLYFDDRINSAAELMISNSIHYLPVIDFGYLKGIVRLKDILYYLDKGE